MKFRVNLIILLSFFLLININIACASDNITLNDSLESDENDEIVLNSSQEDILEEDIGTFTDLSNIISNSGSSINLTKDYKMRIGENSVQLSKSNIVIDGQGHTLDGNNLGNIFSVSGTNIVFKNITFINGNGEKGGAIGDFYGKDKQYTVINCTFENNSASNCGGALYAQYGSIYVYDSVFINNHNNGNGSGGAIFSDMDIYVEGCEFYGNSIVQGEGSAIGSSNGLVSISNSIFPEVQEGKSHIQGSSYQLSNNFLSFSELNNLIANSNGEINLENDYIFIKGYDSGSITISKSITINGNGHVIDANKSTNIFKVNSDNVILRNMILTNAYLYEVNNIGVAVSWSGSNGLLDNVTITNSSFGSSKNAGSYNWWNTGMIYWNGQKGMIDNLKLISNTVASSKGMIIWLGSNGIINNSYFSNCSNTYNSRVGYSQATSFFIYWNALNGKFLNSIVKNLAVSVRDVANPFYVSFVKQGHVENVSFVDCQRSNRGQTLYDLNMPFTPVEDYVKEFNGNFNKHTPTITLDKNIVTVNSVRSGSVTYTICVDFSKTTNVDKNGQFTLDYNFAPSQNYLIKVIYNENDYYTSCVQYFDYNGGDESSFGSFNDLNNLIQSSSDSIINLSKNYVYDPIKDSALSSGITISKSITINGNNHFIDADYNAVRIFTTNANVILNNITFKNSRLNSSGNALLANAQIDINYCTFDNNWAYGQYGGAIKLSGDSSNVKYCTFTNNKALAGAAIVVNSNDNYILHSYFKDNVKDYGGAMNYGSDISVTGGKSTYVNYNAFLDYRPLRQISAEYSRDNWYGSNNLPDSSASGAPGISNYLKANLNYEIKNNELLLGILFTESDTGNIVNVQWANKVIYTIGSNSIISDTLSTVKYSGVTCNAVLDNQWLTNQNSKAWYVKTNGSDYNSGTESNPYKTLSKALQSASDGDIIYVAPGTYVGSDNVKLTISKSVTIDRWGSSGDVIFDGQSNSLIFTLNSNIVLSSLTLKNGKGNNGGALVIKSDSVIIDCTFVDNVATSWGGAIGMNSGDAVIINSRFINNNATLGGGAISTAGVNLNIFNCIFTDNYGGIGGAINSGNTAANLNVVGSTFKFNIADSYGGALIFDGTGNITDSVFINNSAICGGGAVYFWGYNHMISNSKFINNSAVDGGAVIALCTNLTSFNNHFDKNIAYGFGGAIYGTSGDFLVYKDVFSNNIVYYDGGAVYIYKGIGSIYESFFKRNFAGYGGGAIHLLACDLLCSRLGLLNNVSNYLNGYVNTDYLNSFIDFGNYTLVVADTSNYNGSLPSYFSLVDNGWDTAVKNQGSLGICWDYSVIATVETAIKKATGVEVDLSENNVKNLISMYSIYGTGRNPNSGGAVWDALSYLANSLGPVYENLDNTGSFGFSPLLSNSYHISNIAFASRSRDRPLDNDEVKEAIIKYGAVRVSINMDDNHKGYNYYHSTNAGTNHAIALVGWDDNYSRSNFPDGCPGDGAWIVKNSWGPNSGKNGYIYVSYYDQTFAWDGLTYVIFNDTIQYNRVYQYDYSNYGMKSTGNSISWYKNIYTSVNNEGLSAFSTYFNEKTDWEVFVYVGDELKHTQSGNSMGKGYFTFNFDKIIPVAKGGQFTIALKVSNANIPYVSKNLNTLSCGAGVSYYSKDGVTWNDLDKNNQVACLKVFTQNMFGSLLSVDSVADVIYGHDVVVNFDVINRTAVSYSVFSNDGRLIREGSNVNGNQVILSNLDAGEYTFNILNENTAEYVGCIASAKFTVNKAGSDISISPVSSVVYGNNVNVKFSSVNASKLSYVVKNKGTGDVVVAKTAISNLNNFNIGVLDVGVYTVVISNDETANYLKSEASAQFSISKASPNISVTVSNVVYPNDVVVKVKSDVAGSYVVKVGGQSKSVSLKSNVESGVVFSNLGAGDYSVNVDYTETANYNHAYKSSDVKVVKASSNVSINKIDAVFYPNNVNVVYNIVNRTDIDVKVKNIKTNVEITVPASNITNTNIFIGTLDAGEYLITLNNTGNINYDGSFANSKFTINKYSPKIEVNAVNVIYPSDVIVNVKSDVSGKYSVKIADETIDITLFKGQFQQVIFKGLNADENGYKLNVSYLGEGNYNAAFNERIVKVFKASSSVDIFKVTNGVYDTVVPVINVNFENKTTVTYTIYKNGVKINSNPDINSLLSDLHVGEYSINVANAGDDNHNSSSDAVSFKVLKANSKVSINQITNVTYNSPIAVNFNVNNKTIVNYLVKTNSGEIVVKNTTITSNSIVISNLSSGSYIIVISNAENDCYNGDINSAEFTVNKAFNDIEVIVSNKVLLGNVTVKYMAQPVVLNVSCENAINIVGYLYDVGGNLVYNLTSFVGENIILPKLGVGVYSMVLSTVVGSNHVPVSKEYFVCILNEDVVVSKIDVNKKLFYLQSNKCSVRILDVNNNPVNGVNVEFRVNTKVFSVKSDKDGFAHITPNLKPGIYTLRVIVGNKSISNKIVVKHIVVAKNITKIKKSVPKTFIKITVKGHNVKQTVKVKFTYKGKNKVKVKFGKVMKKQTVTVKFKGKTYNVKVNVKGVGTIKLAKKTAKKLKRGKYTTKVNYNGPKLYKKVKVTVKFNGKKYKVKTNKCGVAKFKVTKKMVKKFKKGKKVKYTITYMADKLNRYVKIK